MDSPDDLNVADGRKIVVERSHDEIKKYGRSQLRNWTSRAAQIPI